MSKPNETIGTGEQDDMPRHRLRDRVIRKLFAIGSRTSLYVNESMRVLEMNRQCPRGHAGRMFLARDIKSRREIQRAQMERCTSAASSLRSNTSTS